MFIEFIKNKIKYRLTFYLALIIVASYILLGIIFISRYNSKLEKQINSRLLIPYALIANKNLTYEAVTDNNVLKKIIGLKPEQAYIIGTDNIIYYSNDQSLLNLKLEQTDDYLLLNNKLETLSRPVVEKKIINKKRYNYSISPLYNNQKIIIGYLIIKINTLSIIKAKIKMILFYILAIIILLILNILLIIYITDKIIISRTQNINNIITKLKDGDLNISVTSYNKDDEFGKIETDLSELIHDLNEKAKFAIEIEQGNFDFQYTLESKHDKLGEALITMRDSLKHAAAEEEKRKAEDNIRNWNTIGIAKFSDILRQHFVSLEELAFTIIKELVIYLDANQASIFLIDTEKDEKTLELTATYAFDRRKYLKKSILIGEGLVGACAYEKQTVYLTDIPENYVEIKSGLGQANPTVLLIVPLLREDVIMGVIEIASFNKFEKYHIEFVEKICENIASTLYNVRISAKTTFLLEQSQEQAETMRTQEEEMRQNMEELHSTQEEMARRQDELMARISELEEQLERKQRELDKYKKR